MTDVPKSQRMRSASHALAHFSKMMDEPIRPSQGKWDYTLATYSRQDLWEISEDLIKAAIKQEAREAANG